MAIGEVGHPASEHFDNQSFPESLDQTNRFGVCNRGKVCRGQDVEWLREDAPENGEGEGVAVSTLLNNHRSSRILRHFQLYWGTQCIFPVHEQLFRTYLFFQLSFLFRRHFQPAPELVFSPSNILDPAQCPSGVAEFEIKCSCFGLVYKEAHAQIGSLESRFWATTFGFLFSYQSSNVWLCTLLVFLKYTREKFSTLGGKMLS